MTEQELQEFNAWKAQKEQEERRKLDMIAYRELVDEAIDRAATPLRQLSDDLRKYKREVLETFRDVIHMKSDLLRLSKDDQRSHTFMHSDGSRRITIGVRHVDGYLDTAADGEAIVRECIQDLATDSKSKSLVAMVLKLLSKDAKGSLKASRIVQLRKVAEDSGNARLLEGVRLIEDAYRPMITKSFVKLEVRGALDKEWITVPLAITEVGDRECDIEGIFGGKTSEEETSKELRKGADNDYSGRL